MRNKTRIAIAVLPDYTIWYKLLLVVQAVGIIAAALWTLIH